ncbi:MAG: hypothetical protein WA837_19740 [Xanthobacteraceae bacterium]
MFVIAGVAAVVSPCFAVAQTSIPATPQAAPTQATPDQMETYHATMSRVPVPKKGCFKSAYPSTTWVEVPCGTPPERPYPPASGRQPEIVGNGNDFSAQVTSGTISQATGSFDSITGLTSESDGGNNNSYSLQLNTNASLNPTLCQGAKTPSQCSGWQQFVYSSSGYAFIQYWLLNYGNACPSGWNTYYSDCWRNGTNGAPVSAQPITNLAQLRLTGTADAGGTDTVIMSTPNGDANAANQDSLLDLAKGWNAAEFNVFGDCCGSQANFNGGVTMVVRTSVDNGTKNAPTCTATGYTGETNNLTLVPPCSTVGGASPAIVFKESDPPASIWVYTGTPCSGSSCPGWQLLDDNNESVRIAAGDNSLYQLHNTGKIWHYTGTPCSGGACPGWQMLDDNPVALQIATDGSNLYELHNTGKIWRYTGTPCSGGGSCPGWQMLDDNPAAATIVAAAGNLYELHNTGKIWRYTGTPCSGNNCPGWQQLDGNVATVAIAAEGNNLYQLHKDGEIWRYTGTPCNSTTCPGWQLLDNNPVALAIAAANGNLYELHNTGKIWRYTGTPCSGNSCPGWQMLDDNPEALDIAADGDNLYELHKTGLIWRYTGKPCNGNTCTGWQMLDNNPIAGRIAAAGGHLYEMHLAIEPLSQGPCYDCR